MYIKVRVIAGAKHEKVETQSKDHFKISVKEPAKQNLANKRVVELVAAHFRVAANKVRILNGHQSPSKLLSIQDE
ncbi:MAG: DUF167 domain-containing protein [Patescibacteria group bacterium]|nr:DUF167 domain-containing protein [Patescibacteria group bacterium]